MLRFGRFELQPAQRRLLRDGAPLLVGSRAYDVLLALVERSDRLVSKAELLDTVWAGTVVEENNLQVQISSLRKLLGPEAILTIPGRGYRLGLTARPHPADLAQSGSDPSGGRARPADIQPVAVQAHDGLPALYGRSGDAAVLRGLLRSHRLVTLIGAGGVGKSRLAQDVAVALRDEHANGVGFVDLGLVADPARVPCAIAHALGMLAAGDDEPGVDQVAEHTAALGRALHACDLLLVVDNCEHVVGITARVVMAMLAATAHLTLLVTSQEPLHVPQEQLVRIQPLAVPLHLPQTDVLQVLQVLQVLEVLEAGPALDRIGAVALFVARAREADLRFVLDPSTLCRTMEICRRLGGNPLAIELAAARTPVLGVDGILAMLDDRFKILTGGARTAPLRHQSLRAALDWSHALLDAGAQALYCRFGAFDGVFTLVQAQRLGAAAGIDAWAVLDHLAALVDKSLVVPEPGDGSSHHAGAEIVGYRLSETHRADALERLRESGHLEAVLLNVAPTSPSWSSWSSP